MYLLSENVLIEWPTEGITILIAFASSTNQISIIQYGPPAQRSRLPIFQTRVQYEIPQHTWRMLLMLAKDDEQMMRIHGMPTINQKQHWPLTSILFIFFDIQHLQLYSGSSSKCAWINNRSASQHVVETTRTTTSSSSRRGHDQDCSPR
jgi:hypothetical protein